MANKQHVVLVSQNNFAEDGPRPQVLMAYEDLNMALRAMNVLSLIAKEAGNSLDIQFSIWRFAFLKSPPLSAAAAQQAVQADIIIVAPGNSSGGLATPVASWLEQWTGRRPPRPGALVAVFDPAARHDANSIVVRQLQVAARVTGMDFFCSALDQFKGYCASGRRPRVIERRAFPAGHSCARPLQQDLG